MDVFRTLPKAASLLLQHLASYGELVGQDLARAQQEMRARLLASAIMVFGLFLAVLMGCLGVVASTWDTPNRLRAIEWMGALFLVVAIVSALFRSRSIREKSPWLASVRREWRQDRLLLEDLLSTDEE